MVDRLESLYKTSDVMGYSWLLLGDTVQYTVGHYVRCSPHTHGLVSSRELLLYVRLTLVSMLLHNHTRSNWTICVCFFTLCFHLDLWSQYIHGKWVSYGMPINFRHLKWDWFWANDKPYIKYCPALPQIWNSVACDSWLQDSVIRFFSLN